MHDVPVPSASTYLFIHSIVSKKRFVFCGRNNNFFSLRQFESERWNTFNYIFLFIFSIHPAPSRSHFHPPFGSILRSVVFLVVVVVGQRVLRSCWPTDQLTSKTLLLRCILCAPDVCVCARVVSVREQSTLNNFSFLPESRRFNFCLRLLLAFGCWFLEFIQFFAYISRGRVSVFGDGSGAGCL